MRDNQPCASVNKMTTTRPHQSVPQTSIIHMISHTPPRCGAKGTDAQRQEREQTSPARLQRLECPTVRCPHVMRHRVRGCALQRSLNDWIGLELVCHFTSAHLIHQQRNIICGRFTTCMRRVVVISSRGPSTRGRFTIDRRSISRLTFRVAVCHL